MAGACEAGHLQAELLYRLDGPCEIPGYGIGVAPLPDLDGDGLVDFAVLSEWSDQSDTFSIFGTAVHSGRNGDLLYHLDRQLAAVEDAGDVDGDGVHDLLAVEWEWRGDGAYVFSGADGEEIRHFVLAPGWEWDLPPFAAVGVGDVDGDGRADVAIEDPNTAVVVVYSGADGEVLHTLTAPGPGVDFEYGLAVVADVDSDGAAELAVMSSSEDESGRVQAVLVYSMLDWRLARRIGRFVEPLEASIAGDVGDVDGDGRHDLGLWVRNVPWWPEEYRAYLVLSVVDGRTLIEWPLGPDGEPWGLGVGDLRDVDADGAPDFLFGDGDSPVDLVSTQTRRALLTFGLGGDSMWHFHGVLTDDIDGDGGPDLLLSEPSTRAVDEGDGTTWYWGSVWAYALRGCP